MKYEEIMEKLKGLSDEEKAYGEMSRLNIETENSLGISIKNLREIAKDIEKGHALAERLWNSGVREARILALMLDEPEKVTEKEMENWAEDFNSWDLCDQVCNNLFRRTEHAERKAKEIGRLAVNVACNDVAACGARPKWMLNTILLPDGSRT